MNKTNFWRKARRQYHRKWKFVLVVLPILFWYLYLRVYPNIETLPLSFYEWGPLKREKTFVGLFNYEMLFKVKWDEMLPKMGNTVLYVLFLLVVQTVLVLILTMALRKNTKINKFFRTYFFIPMMFSSTMTALTWTFMLDPNLGVINNALGMLGVEGYPGKVLTANPTVAIFIIVFIHIWSNLGYGMMQILGGLSGISTELTEAATVDGANKWQVFMKIELPLLLPTILRMMLLTITTGAMATDLIYLVGGTYGTKFDTWASWMYRGTLSGSNYGTVSAAASCLFVFLAVATIIQYAVMAKVEKKLFGE